MKVGKEISSKQLTSKIISVALRTKDKKSFSFPKLAIVASIVGAIVLMPLHVSLSTAHASSTANVWWPTQDSHVAGVQPFKALVEGMPIDQYQMYWSVDGGADNAMHVSDVDFPHMEADVDLAGWTWHGSGPYKIIFTAKQGSAVIAQNTVSIIVENGLPQQSGNPVVAVVDAIQAIVAPTTAATIHTTATAPVIDPDPVHQKNNKQDKTIISNTQVAAVEAQAAAMPATQPVQSGVLYVDPASAAAAQAKKWRSSNPTDAQKMDVLAAQPTAKWFGGWSGDIQTAVDTYVSRAAAAGKIPVLVAYNIPQRDCGGYSAGGSTDYTGWIGAFARGIGSNKAIVILEPDALSQIDCLSTNDKDNRYQLLSGAVSMLKSNANTKVYLDAGHSNWTGVDVMGDRLQRANIATADGFSTNVSNFMTVGAESSYGTLLSQRIGNKHFVIDTSRDGNGSNGEWCNPWGRAIGEKPTLTTGNSLIDGYLWLKTPGESDGNCNGGPSAGVWWPEYAVSLVH